MKFQSKQEVREAFSRLGEDKCLSLCTRLKSWKSWETFVWSPKLMARKLRTNVPITRVIKACCTMQIWQSWGRRKSKSESVVNATLTSTTKQESWSPLSWTKGLGDRPWWRQWSGAGSSHSFVSGTFLDLMVSKVTLLHVDTWRVVEGKLLNSRHLFRCFTHKQACAFQCNWYIITSPLPHSLPPLESIVITYEL